MNASKSRASNRSTTSNLPTPAVQNANTEGWGQYLNPLTPGGLFRMNSSSRSVLARADSFTGPPRQAMPFNLETDDAESIESSMWQYIPVCLLPRMLWWLWKRASRGRRETALRRYAGSAVEYPIHAVHLGDRVTFLPTPLRDWWGRPNLMLLWFASSIYMIIVMVLKLGLFYFLATSLIIFPTAIGAAGLGLFGSVRYLKKRHLIGSFDAAPAVEFVKLLALLATMLTNLVVIVYIALQTSWVLRKNACSGGVSAQGGIANCNVQDLCNNWSPCYSPAPKWINGIATLILGIIFLSAALPYIVISFLVFRRARAASHYLVDNLL